jgi:hypothetical protein
MAHVSLEAGDYFEESALMAKRVIRVTKWLGMVPAVAICAACGREFRVPVESLKRLTESQESLERQFDRHQCDVGNKTSP